MPETPEKTVIMLDETVNLYHQGYALDRLLKIGDYKVRLRLKRDSYIEQSYARAEVFTPALTWTAVLDNPPYNWHTRLPYSSDSSGTTDEARGLLGSIADDLTNRIITFLEA